MTFFLPLPRTPSSTLFPYTTLFRSNYGLRYIFTDGRGLPASDAQPWWYGYSVGKWDGDTLVVDTTGFRDDGWLDIIGDRKSTCLNSSHVEISYAVFCLKKKKKKKDR